MSTRSRIGCVQPDGTIKSICCRHDGYLDGVGKILLESYCDPKKIEALIALGDLSSLYDTLEDITAYMRDRGETGCEATESPDAVDFLSVADGSGGEYAYLWADGHWTVWDHTDDVNEGQHLTAALVAEVLS